MSATARLHEAGARSGRDFPAHPTIATLRRQLAAGQTSHQALVEQALDAARTAPLAHTFTALYEAGAREAARHADAMAHAGVALPPLAGLPVSIKDLYDVAGEATLAGSVVRRGAAPAQADAPSVARLRGAGAAIVGRTNMSEFAFSGVGINPHFGTPANPADPLVPRVPGGSSSGAAVSVAAGLCVAGLGSDTGGSIRIPAALCGIVGFKNTQSRVPIDGAFPLSHTLDTVCAMARSVADCLVVDGVLAGAPLAVHPRPLDGMRLAVPQTLVLDALDDTVARAFASSLSVLSAAGARLVDIPLAELAEVARLNAPGGFSAVEAWATHRDAMRERRDAFDPRVAARIALGEPVSAGDYIVMQRRRMDWMARTTGALAGFDAFICPTVPIVAPPIAELMASDEAFFKANGLLLRNTFTVNFLDGCAFSLPCHQPGELPVGLMLAAPGGRDAALAGVALAVEAALQRG
jgi:aspartyl-tRNA(Asn)/glutamyl-tRNA(Gln) amidotransferase subunit A